MDTTKTGQGMFIAASLLAIAMLTWFFAGVEERQNNPNGDPDSVILRNAVEVPLLQNRYGHYVVSGTINGQGVDFLLDTGATDVVIPEEIAQRLRLPYGQSGQAMTANGPVRIYRTRLDKLTIGEIELRDVNASINAAMGPDEILLGMSALRHIEFTQRGRTLTLRQISG